MTLSKIAKLANVSVSTASKAFSMSSEVSDETREIIFDVAKKHGCFKKFFNAKYPKLVTAVICPEIESHYYANIIGYLGKRLAEKNCEITVATTAFSHERAKEIYAYYSKYARVDGVVLIDSASALEIESDIPTVCIGRTKGAVPTVFSDTSIALSEAIDYLISKDVRDIGFLGDTITKSREKAFIQTLREKNCEIDEEKVVFGDRFAEGGYNTAKLLIKKRAVPRALICAYDYLAIGAIRAFTEAGLSVPDDVAVIGFDDIAEARFLNPPLSSISTDVDQLCAIASEKLLAVLMDKDYETETTINATLNLRLSSKII